MKPITGLSSLWVVLSITLQISKLILCDLGGAQQMSSYLDAHVAFIHSSVSSIVVPVTHENLVWHIN